MAGSDGRVAGPGRELSESDFQVHESPTPGGSLDPDLTDAGGEGLKHFPEPFLVSLGILVHDLAVSFVLIINPMPRLIPEMFEDPSRERGRDFPSRQGQLWAVSESVEFPVHQIHDLLGIIHGCGQDGKEMGAETRVRVRETDRSGAKSAHDSE